MSEAESLTQLGTEPEIIQGDSTYYMVYTGTVEKLNDWLKTRKGKDTVLPILDTRPVRIWCPNDNNRTIRLEKRNDVQGVSPNFPDSS
jgi:hypothetical protein